MTSRKRVCVQEKERRIDVYIHLYVSFKYYYYSHIRTHTHIHTEEYGKENVNKRNGTKKGKTLKK